MNGTDEAACRAAAYHEAGHIVAAIILGLQISPKGIRIGSFADGQAFFTGADPGVPVSSSDVERTVIALLAGGLAHARVQADVQGACGGDEARIEEILADELKEPIARQERRSEMLKQAKLLMDQHWESVAHVAEALCEKVWQPVRRHSSLPMEKRLSASDIQKAMPCIDVIPEGNP